MSDHTDPDLAVQIRDILQNNVENLQQYGTEALDEADNWQKTFLTNLQGQMDGATQLNSLYENKYKDFFLQYPSNVDNAMEERHWIRFDVKKFDGQKMVIPDSQNAGDVAEADSFFGRLYQSGVEKATAVAKASINVPLSIATTSVNEFLNGVPLFGGAAKELIDSARSPENKKSKSRQLGSILLYAPFQRTDTSGFTWNTNSSTGFLGNNTRSAADASAQISTAINAGKSLIDGDSATSSANVQKFKSIASMYAGLQVSEAVSSVTGSYLPNLRNQLLRGGSVALNNHLESFFNDVQMRSFTFEFQLSPKTPDEARTIQQIIKMFKFAGHPGIIGDSDSFLSSHFQYPEVFDIEIYNEAQTHKILTCALTNMSTSYGGPTMNNTFYDLYPVQVTLSLTFTELEILDKIKVDAGY